MPRHLAAEAVLPDPGAHSIEHDVERDAVVVAHGGVMRVLRGLILGLQPAQIFALDVPQDKVLVVEAGRTHWL